MARAQTLNKEPWRKYKTNTSITIYNYLKIDGQTETPLVMTRNFCSLLAVIKQTLNTVMVKASLMLKVNGDLLSYDTTKVFDLGKEWRNSNPIMGRNIRKTITAMNRKTMLIMRTVVLVIMATMAITATVAAASSNF